MSKLLRYICDRMNGAKYGAPEFYWWVSENLPEEDARPLMDAIDSGDENNVKNAIREHFNRHQLYPLALHYVSAVNWLQDDPEQSSAHTYGTYVTMHSTEHALDLSEDEYEIEATCQADARLTLKRQILSTYQQALLHGHKPWQSLIIEPAINQNEIDLVSIRCRNGDRKRVKDTFTALHEQNRNLPATEQKEIIIPNVEIKATVKKMDGTEFEVYKEITLHVTHQHIWAHPRSWYQRKGIK